MKFRFLREEIVLKIKIIKSLFTVESTSRDEQNFTHKIERIKNKKKIVSVLKTHLAIMKEIATERI